MRHLFLFILIFTNACGLKAQNYVQVRCDNDRLSIIDSKKKLQTLSCYPYKVEDKTLIIKSENKTYRIRPNDTSLFKRVAATPVTVAFENSTILNKEVYYVGFLYSSSSASTNPTIHVISSTIAGQTITAAFLGDAYFSANGLSSLNAPSSYTLLEPKIPKSHMVYYGVSFPIAFK